jgi:hypothetical protein
MGYAKIPNLYKEQTITMFRECWAMEKVHGTSAHIGWTREGKLYFFSGGETHDRFVELFDQDKLNEAYQKLEHLHGKKVVIYGEAYGGKQQGMSKTYGPKLHFIAFDVLIEESFLSTYDADAFVTGRFGLEFVPYVKIPTTKEAMDAERDRDSEVAIRRGMGSGHIREGVVLRPLIEVRTNNGERIVSKHKRDEFREHASKRDGVSAEDLKVLEDAEAVAEEWCVPNRLEHVIQHLTLNGVEPTMERMRDVVHEMVKDIYTEAADEIVESKAVEKSIGKKTVQLFKKRLENTLAPR